MKLITAIFVVATLVLIKQCQSTKEKTSGFYCPKSGETNLMTTTVSGCKVHYTCVNGSVSKIFQCSESQPLEGTTHACEENPQCLRINILQELKNLPMIVEKLESLKAEPEIESSESAVNSSMDTVVRFFKCLANVDNIDDLSKTCIDSTLFQNKAFLNIELPIKGSKVYSKLFNPSINLEDGENKILKISLGKVLKAFVTYLASDCEMVCKNEPKLDKHLPQTAEDQFYTTDSSHTSGDAYEKAENPNRVRRSQPTNTFGLLNILMNPRRYIQSQVSTVEPSATTPVLEVKSKMEDNGTLMSNVIVPIVKDIVSDEDALKNLTNCFRAAFEAFVPLATEILKASNESFSSDQKPILKIPRAMVETTVGKIYDDAYPFLRSFLSVKLPYILRLLSENTKLIFRSWEEMESRLEPNLKELRSKGNELFWKYYGMYRTSDSGFVHTYSLIEIQQDLESLYSLLPEVSKELVLKNWSVFQDITGITTGNVANLLLDVPGIFEAIDLIPYDQLLYFFMLLI
ncbi:hypothetical protein JTE90_027020 [Oedothorax gibbosus]|uniref:Chitin-binding type-2 domain-containing protein n=1 Tax=Oedothorax gibbosus TaxID=931172 RepID=A0AAV6VC90_9ARAC|nr:hypothetical protein JTE90_027020 [Oedothorax gibbosus]